MAFDLDDAAGVRLDFEGTELDGLHVRMRPASIGGLLEIAAAAEDIGELQEGGNPAGLQAKLRTVLEPVAAVLASWDLTAGGAPVPADLDGLLRLTPAMLGRIIGAYVTAQSQAGDELGKDSPDGGTSPEALTAAAALSSSLPSSAGPS
jgi:hypothetical protein